MKTKHERPAGEKRPMKERVRRMFGRRFRAGGYAVFAAAAVLCRLFILRQNLEL